jgi:hypothetical protein
MLDLVPHLIQLHEPPHIFFANSAQFFSPLFLPSPRPFPLPAPPGVWRPCRLAASSAPSRAAPSCSRRQGPRSTDTGPAPEAGPWCVNLNTLRSAVRPDLFAIDSPSSRYRLLAKPATSPGGTVITGFSFCSPRSQTATSRWSRSRDDLHPTCRYDGRRRTATAPLPLPPRRSLPSDVPPPPEGWCPGL